MSGPQGAASGQPFEFTPETMAKAKYHLAKYPAGRERSATMPLLDLAQRQNGGWLTREAMDYVAHLLNLAPIRVYEVATFYTMYFHHPVGKHHVRVCTTTPCALRGAEDVLAACEAHLGIHVGETTSDGLFTLGEVECSGACVNAPVVEIGDDYYEDVDPDIIKRVLDAFRRGETPKPGPQNGRKSSEPIGGATTLNGAPPYAQAAPAGE